MQRIVALVTAVVVALPLAVFAQEGDAVDLMDMSLDDLLNMQVSSVSKKAESMMDVASAIYVITDEDIRRSGATRLTEVLNLAPGAFFIDMSLMYQASSIRNAGGPYTPSILMLVDGIPITSPTTASITEAFDLPLEQIERIEVIKGPGGTIYGANACTGIINIYTKDAQKTEGLTARLTGESISLINPFIRYGHKISDKMYASLYAKYLTTPGYDKNPVFEEDSITVVSPVSGQELTYANVFTSDETDGKNSMSLGGHLSLALNDKLLSSTKVHFSGVTTKEYSTSLVDPVPSVFERNNIDFAVTERIDYQVGDAHSVFANLKFRKLVNEWATGGGYEDNTTLFDVEIQDNFYWMMNNVISGVNFRTVNYSMQNDFDKDVNFNNEDNTELLYAGFIQDQLNLFDNLDVTLGVKGETWTLVSDDMEFSPSARMAYKPLEDVTLWGAVSRSITTPGYIQTDLEYRQMELPAYDAATATAIGTMLGMGPVELAQFVATSSYYNSLLVPGTHRIFLGVVANDDVKPTDYMNYEVGFRTSIIPNVLLDFTGFYSDIDNGISLDTDFMSKAVQQSVIFDSISILPMYYTNIYKGRHYGGEFVAKIVPVKNLRLELSYSLFKTEIEPLKDANGNEYEVSNPSDPGTPNHIIRFRPYLDLPQWGTYVTLNFTYNSKRGMGENFGYYYDVTTGSGGVISAPEADNEYRLDFSVEKRFMDDKLGLSVWGKNVLVDSEYVNYYTEYISLGYPKIVHPVYGGSVSYGF